MYTFRFGEGITDIDIKLAALHGETLVMPMPTRDVAKALLSKLECKGWDKVQGLAAVGLATSASSVQSL